MSWFKKMVCNLVLFVCALFLTIIGTVGAFAVFGTTILALLISCGCAIAAMCLWIPNMYMLLFVMPNKAV